MQSNYLRTVTLLLAVALGFGSTCVPASAADERTKADLAWQHLERYLTAAPGIVQIYPEVGAGPEYLVVRETYARVIRRYGLRFHDNFPDDPRRLRWLPVAVSCEPLYWLDAREGAGLYVAAHKTPGASSAVIPQDEAARDEWNARYPQLRAEFLGSPHVSVTDQAQLRLNEMRRRVHKETRAADVSPLYAATEEGCRFRHQLQEEVLELGNLEADWSTIDRGDSYVELMADTLLDAYWIVGDGDAASAYIAQLAGVRSAHLQEFARGKFRIMDLTRTALTGRYTAIDGREIDLESLRGKVVLIQYWATDCAGCVGQLPKLKRLYQKYHEQGFEVIGYCRQASADKNRVAEYVAKRELPWPQRLDPNLREDYERYSFTWVSNLLLLDKSGKLVMHSSGPSEAQLDSLIARQLALEPSR